MGEKERRKCSVRSAVQDIKGGINGGGGGSVGRRFSALNFHLNS